MVPSWGLPSWPYLTPMVSQRLCLQITQHMNSGILAHEFWYHTEILLLSLLKASGWAPGLSDQGFQKRPWWLDLSTQLKFSVSSKVSLLRIPGTIQGYRSPRGKTTWWCKKQPGGLGRWLHCEEHSLLLQRSRVQFLASTLEWLTTSWNSSYKGFYTSGL